MGAVQPGRFTADHDGDIVVFLIGMRVNRLWKVHKWLPTAMSMPPMLRELQQHPELGLLGVQQFVGGRTTMLVQYWRSFEDLERFARDGEQTHLPAWRAFNRRVGTSGDVGIFHETFVVPAGGSESLYNNMPLFGLARATARIEVGRKGQAAGYRMGRVRTDAPAEPVPT
jgi:hypothetical protein